jgi:hypothetical protein
MSRQIAVVMTQKDERDFLAFLRGTADIQIMRTRAPTPALLVIDEFPAPASGAWQFVIWNKAFAWTPRIERASDGSYFLARYTTGPVIEYLRDQYSYRASRGRIFWPTSPDPETLQANAPAVVLYSYDHAQFRPWYEKIVRWVINTGTRRGRRGRARWYLPNAFWRYGWYRF